MDDISMATTLAIVDEWVKKGEKHYIATPNPEFVVTAQEDREFKKILNQAGLSLPDGFGLNLFGGVKNRVAGTDLLKELSKKSYTFFFLGGRNGSAEKTIESFRRKNPSIKAFADDGPVEALDESTDEKWVKEINARKPDVLCVGFGHPKQEKWIARNLDKLDIKVAIGVGGAFDYISGTVPRAPFIMRKLGLEWIFRLILQPQRLKRIFKAVFVFPLLVWKDAINRFFKEDEYL